MNSLLTTFFAPSANMKCRKVEQHPKLNKNNYYKTIYSENMFIYNFKIIKNRMIFVLKFPDSKSTKATSFCLCPYQRAITLTTIETRRVNKKTKFHGLNLKFFLKNLKNNETIRSGCRKNFSRKV